MYSSLGYPLLHLMKRMDKSEFHLHIDDYSEHVPIGFSLQFHADIK